MALEQGLYAQVIMILRRELDDIKEKYKTTKFNLEGQSAKTKHWFDLDHEGLKDNFMTREPDFYKRLYQTKFMGDTTQEYQKFGVPIGNTKTTKKVQFRTEAPLIQYH